MGWELHHRGLGHFLHTAEKGLKHFQKLKYQILNWKTQFWKLGTTTNKNVMDNMDEIFQCSTTIWNTLLPLNPSYCVVYYDLKAVAEKTTHILMELPL